MAQNTTISIAYKIEGVGNGFQKLTVDADAFRKLIGGIADINKVVGITSTVIKNYGLEWGAAADIHDKIQLTAKNGVTSF